MTTTWTIAIDWQRDGTYTDETSRVLSAKWTPGFQQAYQEVANDAQLALVLRNRDGRFTPDFVQQIYDDEFLIDKDSILDLTFKLDCE